MAEGKREEKIWLAQTPDLKYAYIAKLLLSLAAGCTDAFSIPTLHVFVANMTGNVVFLSLAAGNLHSLYPDLIRPLTSGLSLIAFAIGAFVVGRAQRIAGPELRKSRGFIAGFALLEAAIFFLVAGLSFGHQVLLFNKTSLVIIMLLSGCMGSQQVWHSALGSNTIMVSVLTGAAASLMSEDRTWKLKVDPVTLQRIEFLLCFFFGGVIGALCLRYDNISLAILITAVLRLMAAVVILMLPSQQATKEQPKAERKT